MHATTSTSTAQKPEKRTRSQLSNFHFEFTLQRSPLKDARDAMRKANQQHTPPLESEGDSRSHNRSTCIDIGDEDEILLSPKKRAGSPSYQKGDHSSSKRVKHELKGPLPALFAKQFAKQPPKDYSQNAQAGSSKLAGSSARFTATQPSVLVSTATPAKKIPHLDLSMLTPSPKKAVVALGMLSPVKSKLRIVSEGSSCSGLKVLCGGSERSKSEEPEAKAASRLETADDPPPLLQDPRPPTPRVAPEDQDLSVTMPPSGMSPNGPAPSGLSTPSRSINCDTECSDPVDASKISEDIDTAPLQTPAPPSRTIIGLTVLPPMSPLTPLPPTPWVAKTIVRETIKLGVPSRKPEETMPPPAINVASRLPRPSSLSQDPSSLVPLKHSQSTQAKRAKQVPAARSAAQNPRAPVTRSVALKQKQRAASVQPTARSPSPVKRASTVQPTSPIKRASSVLPSSRLTSTAQSEQDQRTEKGPPGLKRSATCLPSPGPFDFDAGDRAESSKTGAEGGQPLKRRKSFVLTIPSSLSPVKNVAPRSGSEKRPLYPPPITDAATKARSQSSLSTLSMALEKLALPPPVKVWRDKEEDGERDRPRPSTTLGFTRDDLFSPPVAATDGNKAGSSVATAAASLKRTSSAAGVREPFLPPVNPFSAARKGKERAMPPMRFGMGGSSSGVGGRVALGVGVGAGIFKRPFEKASKKPPLDTVEGSPVKGPSNADSGVLEVETQEGSRSISISETSIADALLPTASEGDESVQLEHEGSASLKREHARSMPNASRRASMAFSTLTQSLAELPKKREAVVQTPASHGVTTTRTLRSAVVAATPPMGQRNGLADPASAPAALGGDKEGGAGSGAYVKKRSGRVKMPGSLDVLKACTIFVDVRTEEGEDAGGLFVDMLRGLGAKVLARVGPSCTHIVYKNGLPSTVSRHRLLDEPRPSVVGIGWVVECVEKRAHVDEKRFHIDLSIVNVAGSNKRRRSIVPKQLSMFDFGEPSADDNRLDASSTCDNDSSQSDHASQELAPLEKARQRSGMFPRPRSEL